MRVELNRPVTVALEDGQFIQSDISSDHVRIGDIDEVNVASREFTDDRTLTEAHHTLEVEIEYVKDLNRKLEQDHMKLVTLIEDLFHRIRALEGKKTRKPNLNITNILNIKPGEDS